MKRKIIAIVCVVVMACAAVMMTLLFVPRFGYTIPLSPMDNSILSLYVHEYKYAGTTKLMDGRRMDLYVCLDAWVKIAYGDGKAYAVYTRGFHAEFDTSGIRRSEWETLLRGNTQDRSHFEQIVYNTTQKNYVLRIQCIVAIVLLVGIGIAMILKLPPMYFHVPRSKSQRTALRKQRVVLVGIYLLTCTMLSGIFLCTPRFGRQFSDRDIYSWNIRYMPKPLDARIRVPWLWKSMLIDKEDVYASASDITTIQYRSFATPFSMTYRSFAEINGKVSQPVQIHYDHRAMIQGALREGMVMGGESAVFDAMESQYNFTLLYEMVERDRMLHFWPMMSITYMSLAVSFFFFSRRKKLSFPVALQGTTTQRVYYAIGIFFYLYALARALRVLC